MQSEFSALSMPVAAELPTASEPAQIIPLSAHESFHAMPAEEQMRVSMLLKLFQEIESAPEGVVSAITRIAMENTERGFSRGNLKALYYAWRAAKRNWLVLRRRWGNTSKLPAEFQEEVKRRCENNHRGARQALLSIKADWSAGQSIPGYGTWSEYYREQYPERDVPPSWPLGFYPTGWSQSNLYTKQSSRAERMLKRRGFHAAKRFLPSLLRDTSGLRFLELITIDDFETDIVVQARHPVTGRFELCTCTGLLAQCVGTRTFVGLGLKPRFRSEAGVRMAITRADVQQLLFSVFSEHGMPADYGVTLLVENAAAAVTKDFELALETLLGVQVARTGLLHAKTLRNGFVQGGGKPWEKGWVESTFNLGHNMAGAMPGQKGASYQLKPGDHEAQVLFAEKLLNLDGLTPEQAAQLRVPFLPFEAALDGYTKIFRAMEQRTAHSMEGFREVVEYMLPDGSQTVGADELALVAPTREDVLACKCVPRMESPLERKARVTAGVQFVKVAEPALALLLLTPKQVELRNHKITFTHLGQGFTFSDADSPVLALPEGTPLLGYFEGAGAATLYCTHLDGRYVGPVKRRGRVDIRDQAAIGLEQGEIARIITKHVVAPLRERHAGEDARLADDNAHNLAKLREWGVEERLIPARLLPPAPKSAPASTRAGTSHPSHPEGADASTALIGQAPPSNVPGAVGIHGQDKRPAATSLSALLGREPARDAFTAHREALARGVATVELERAKCAASARSLADLDEADLPDL